MQGGASIYIYIYIYINYKISTGLLRRGRTHCGCVFRLLRHSYCSSVANSTFQGRSYCSFAAAQLLLLQVYSYTFILTAVLKQITAITGKQLRRTNFDEQTSTNEFRRTSFDGRTSTNELRRTAPTNELRRTNFDKRISTDQLRRTNFDERIATNELRRKSSDERTSTNELRTNEL